MKKIITYLLGLCLCFSMTSCTTSTKEKSQNFNFPEILYTLNDNNINHYGIFTYDKNKEITAYKANIDDMYSQLTVNDLLYKSIIQYYNDQDSKQNFDETLIWDIQNQVTGDEASIDYQNEVVTKLIDLLETKTDKQLDEDTLLQLQDNAKKEAYVIAENRIKQQAQIITQLFNITQENTENFACSSSIIITKAYGIVIIQPKEGKINEVKDNLNAFITSQKNNFESYLQDQYLIASNAKIEILESGIIIMVMSDNAEEIFTKIKNELI